MNTTGHYSSAEACELADISYRQLDYWCRVGTVRSAIEARGSGTRRRWTWQQVMVLAVLARVGGHARISQLDELAAVLGDWSADEWDTTTLLVGEGGIWTPDDCDAPPVAIAVNLGAIAREVESRASVVAA